MSAHVLTPALFFRVRSGLLFLQGFLGAGLGVYNWVLQLGFIKDKGVTPESCGGRLQTGFYNFGNVIIS